MHHSSRNIATLTFRRCLSLSRCWSSVVKQAGKFDVPRDPLAISTEWPPIDRSSVGRWHAAIMVCCEHAYRCHPPYAPLCLGAAHVPEHRVFCSMRCPPLRSAQHAALACVARVALQAVCDPDHVLLHPGLAGVRGRAADDGSGRAQEIIHPTSENGLLWIALTFWACCWPMVYLCSPAACRPSISPPRVAADAREELYASLLGKSQAFP